MGQVPETATAPGTSASEALEGWGDGVLFSLYEFSGSCKYLKELHRKVSREKNTKRTVSNASLAMWLQT